MNILYSSGDSHTANTDPSVDQRRPARSFVATSKCCIKMRLVNIGMKIKPMWPYNTNKILLNGQTNKIPYDTKCIPTM